ncbi:kinase-like domain-containing protein [Armillaria novae-zelandiae]|uniref:Kinase-like domain-containing protein n=1 Tax=Armillaria novae-zelandiae TaxID=153914 RepID=A0AA39P394_9AGAR|nr:kinase-like domain-containing protein [Armillaria novae-zelandiae]
MQQNLRPTMKRALSISDTLQPRLLGPPSTMHVKRVTLTSKKNWWMVELNNQEDDNATPSINSFSSEETVVDGLDYQQLDPSEPRRAPTPPPSPPIYNPPRHPTSIFSFPTPTAYSAPPNPTVNLSPVAQGSASVLFKCVVKKPDVIQLEINGEMQSNASDVTVQFLAELRVYTTVTRHRNICAFLGALENVGMVLEYIDGLTLYDVAKIDFHDQLLDGLTHLHSFGFSHGDLSLLNVQVTVPANTIKLLDFDSIYTSPDDEPVDPVRLSRAPAVQKIEQIHPGTRPFCAPEILRGEFFGIILVCLDRCEHVDMKPWEQRKDLIPKDFFHGCEVFEERAREYLRKWNDSRRRLVKTDMFECYQNQPSV